MLLGLRIAPKEATQVSSAEFVYGTTLTAPGEFLGAPELPPKDFLRRLRSTTPNSCSQQHAYPKFRARQPKTRQFRLHSTRCPSTPPTPLYHEPYQVIERGPKTFRLKMGDKEEVV